MPLGESMISTIKSNKSIMLNKSKRFRKTQGGYGKNRKTEYDFPKASPEKLIHIRKRLKRENRLLWTKVVSVSAVIIIGIVWMLLAS